MGGRAVLRLPQALSELRGFGSRVLASANLQEPEPNREFPRRRKRANSNC